MYGADSNDKHPMKGYLQICFIRNTVSNPNIMIGDYTYYDDPEDSENFERNVLHHFPFIGDQLIIGKFCALVSGVKFIMNGANHQLDGFSIYPFQIFGNGWEKGWCSRSVEQTCDGTNEILNLFSLNVAQIGGEEQWKNY